MLGTALSKKEDRLRESARLMLLTGNFQDYCEIMMSLGDYEKAIAYAPKVNMKYWRKCVDRYTDYLAGKPSIQTKDGKIKDPEEELVSFLLLKGEADGASRLLLQRGETQDAKLVRSLMLNGGFFTDPLARHSAVKQEKKTCLDFYDLDYKQPELNSFVVTQAQLKFIQNQPLLAAASHLSLSDPRRAIEKLYLANELELAFSLADLFYKEIKDQICASLFLRSISGGELEIAARVASLI